MRRALPLTLLLLILAGASQAANAKIQYVSDTQYIPLRSGPGNDYRITHRGIPSGTRLDIKRTSDNGEYAEIVTAKGTKGWIRTQYLMSELPAQNKVAAAQSKAEALGKENSKLKAAAKELSGERVELLNSVNNTEGNLNQITEELTQLKQISGQAVQLDIDNRRLTLETEELRSAGEMLEAENRRLQDNLDSEAFMNGALAVLLGVIITLVVPRLFPKRRKSSSWA
ncbi:MAG: TIGR04211 family SH3 domain-containing protein [Halioglobus sp.]